MVTSARVDGKVEYQLTEPDVFVDSEERDRLGIPSGANSYASTAAYSDVLWRACKIFGVSRHRLASLLGCVPSILYTWMGPNSKRRPSSKYLVRLLKLYEFHDRGVSLAIVKEIDWLSGKGIEIPNDGKGQEDHPRYRTARRRR